MHSFLKKREKKLFPFFLNFGALFDKTISEMQESIKVKIINENRIDFWRDYQVFNYWRLNETSNLITKCKQCVMVIMYEHNQFILM